MATAQVVDAGPEEAVEGEDEEPIDIDAEMEADAAGTTNIFDSGQYVVKEIEDEEEKKDTLGGIKSVRKYDLSINYDFYHQTPRLWLLGYDEDG